MVDVKKSKILISVHYRIPTSSKSLYLLIDFSLPPGFPYVKQTNHTFINYIPFNK